MALFKDGPDGPEGGAGQDIKEFMANVKKMSPYEIVEWLGKATPEVARAAMAQAEGTLAEKGFVKNASPELRAELGSRGRLRSPAGTEAYLGRELTAADSTVSVPRGTGGNIDRYAEEGTQGGYVTQDEYLDPATGKQMYRQEYRGRPTGDGGIESGSSYSSSPKMLGKKTRAKMKSSELRQ